MPPEYTEIYESLSPIEQDYWHRFNDLFALVEAKQPEKGILALIQRAKVQATSKNLPLESALSAEFKAAEKRTQRRLALLQSCSID